MLFILLSWIYITAILFLTGSLFIDLAKKLFGLQTTGPLHFSIVTIAGMAVTTFLVTLLCLFMPVGIIAHIIILGIAAIYGFLKRKRLVEQWGFYRLELKNTSWVIKTLFGCFLFIMAYISAQQSSHYDDGLYYSGSIKWLQEYGTVPGLADLNPRIGFNSSWLILQSFFGFPFLASKLLNDLNGLLYMLVFMYNLQGIRKMLKGNKDMATFLQSFFFLPVIALHFSASHDLLLYNINLFSAPSPDVPASFITWMVFVLFLQKQPDAAFNKPGQLIIVLLICFLLTIKLSSIPILLLVLAIIWPWLYKKQFKPILLITAGSLLFLAPWLARNILVSGYLVFPFARLDLFSFDWKLPVGHVLWHENAVRIWAINPEFDLGKDLSVPVTEWFPGWFERLSYIQSAIVMIIILSAVLWPVVITVQLIKKGSYWLKANSQLLFFIATCLAGVLFWFFKGPDLRLGFGFCLIFCTFSLSAFVKYFTDSYPRAIGSCLLLFMFWIFYANYRPVWGNAPFKKLTTALPGYPVPKQKDSVALSPDILLYLPKDEPCQNCPLPCTMGYEYGSLHTVLRGKTLKEGFRASSQ